MGDVPPKVLRGTSGPSRCATQNWTLKLSRDLKYNFDATPAQLCATGLHRGLRGARRASNSVVRGHARPVIQEPHPVIQEPDPLIGAIPLAFDDAGQAFRLRRVRA